MKIAISGKGGVGKTTISGTLCRVFGRRGRDVLAIDGDPNPNLAVVLGLPLSETVPISTDLLAKVTDDDGAVRYDLSLTMDELLDRHGFSAPDNVRLLMVGKPDHAGTGCMCGSHAVIREIVHAALADSGRITVLDMEASLEHMKRGTSKYVDTMYVVVEPYYRALEAARRIRDLAEELDIHRVAAIANKVRDPEDERTVRAFCEKIGLDLAAVVPFDESLVTAERSGTSAVEMKGDSPFLDRISTLADQMLEAA